MATRIPKEIFVPEDKSGRERQAAEDARFHPVGFVSARSDMGTAAFASVALLRPRDYFAYGGVSLKAYAGTTSALLWAVRGCWSQKGVRSEPQRGVLPRSKRANPRRTQLLRVETHITLTRK